MTIQEVSTLKRLPAVAAITGVLAAGSLASAAAAVAAPVGGEPADQAINELKARGYNVQLNLNGGRDVPLSECTVTGAHGFPPGLPIGAPAPSGQFVTVYVDVDCPSDN
jgi:hypothetical protein